MWNNWIFFRFWKGKDKGNLNDCLAMNFIVAAKNVESGWGLLRMELLRSHAQRFVSESFQFFSNNYSEKLISNNELTNCWSQQNFETFFDVTVTKKIADLKRVLESFNCKSDGQIIFTKLMCMIRKLTTWWISDEIGLEEKFNRVEFEKWNRVKSRGRVELENLIDSIRAKTWQQILKFCVLSKNLHLKFLTCLIVLF